MKYTLKCFKKDNIMKKSVALILMAAVVTALFIATPLSAAPGDGGRGDRSVVAKD